jgi:hypothetical protein
MPGLTGHTRLGLGFQPLSREIAALLFVRGKFGKRTDPVKGAKRREKDGEV